jgi:hypothetical protein
MAARGEEGGGLGCGCEGRKEEGRSKEEGRRKLEQQGRKAAPEVAS